MMSARQTGRPITPCRRWQVIARVTVTVRVSGAAAAAGPAGPGSGSDPAAPGRRLRGLRVRLSPAVTSRRSRRLGGGTQADRLGRGPGHPEPPAGPGSVPGLSVARAVLSLRVTV